MFHLRQARGVGFSPATLRKRAGACHLHRIHHAVYSLVPRHLLSREGRWMAAVLACGPGAVLSHRSAAALHALMPSSATRIDVTVPDRSARKHDGIRVHRSTTLTPADTTIENGIPSTTVARTILDLGEVAPRRAVERACDQAEVMQVLDTRALDDQLARNPTRRAARVLRSVLAEHYAGSTVTWSQFEEAFLALVRRAGLPRPEVNYFIVLGDGGPAIRADFVWPAHRVVIETDGHGTHRTRQAFERDRKNDLRLSAAGWRPGRVTWRRMHDEPALVERTLRALLHS